MKKLVLFGAGRIGRAFIGQLFARSGFEVVFIDIDQNLINELNRRKSYPVVIKGKTEETILVENVRAVSGLDRDAVIKEVAKTSIMAVSVGKNALGKIIPVIAEGLKRRQELTPDRPLDIIIAENMRSAGEFIRSGLAELLPKNYPLDKLVGLVETSIGKMVPIMTEEELTNDPLLIFAEPYNTLILDKYGFKGQIPEVKGLSPKENIKAWVDRKAFVHNLGHATAAYFGAYKNPAATYIYEVLDDPEVYGFVKEVMLQSASILHAIYPDELSMEDLNIHINDLLCRFRNKALKDTIYRVGQDRMRKLGPDDRFMGVVRLGETLNMKCDKIMKAMAYAFFFRAKGEKNSGSEQDRLFDNYLSKGLMFTLNKVCGLDRRKDSRLFKDFEEIEEMIKNIRHVNLDGNADFQDVYTEEMTFLTQAGAASGTPRELNRNIF